MLSELLLPKTRDLPVGAITKMQEYLICVAQKTPCHINSAITNAPSRIYSKENKASLCKTEECIPYGCRRQRILLHPYYTPFFTKIQVNLAKIAFFVDYDGDLCLHFYVN